MSTENDDDNEINLERTTDVRQRAESLEALEIVLKWMSPKAYEDYLGYESQKENCKKNFQRAKLNFDRASAMLQVNLYWVEICQQWFGAAYDKHVSATTDSVIPNVAEFSLLQEMLDAIENIEHCVCMRRQRIAREKETLCECMRTYAYIVDSQERLILQATNVLFLPS